MEHKYLGVHLFNDKYHATINHNRTKIRIGSYDDPVTAAKARDIRCLALYGENAVLNFPRETYQ